MFRKPAAIWGEHSIDFGKLEQATAPLQLGFGRYMVNSGAVKRIGGREGACGA